jgi:hypothetical protein
VVLTPPWSFQDSCYFTFRVVKVAEVSDLEAFSTGPTSISIHFAIIKDLSNVMKGEM